MTRPPRSPVSEWQSNLLIRDESAARQVTLVLCELSIRLLSRSRGLCALGSRGHLVDGAEIVETAARDELSRRAVRAGHDPRRSQRDGVHLVGGESVPDDELTVLRSGHQVAAVGGRPVQRVNLAEVALEDAPLLHRDRRLGKVGRAGNLGD